MYVTSTSCIDSIEHLNINYSVCCQRHLLNKLHYTHTYDCGLSLDEYYTEPNIHTCVPGKHRGNRDTRFPSVVVQTYYDSDNPDQLLHTQVQYCRDVKTQGYTSIQKTSRRSLLSTDSSNGGSNNRVCVCVCVCVCMRACVLMYQAEHTCHTFTAIKTLSSRTPAATAEGLAPFTTKGPLGSFEHN